MLNPALQRLLILNDRLAEKTQMQRWWAQEATLVGTVGFLICNFQVPAFVSQSCGRLIRRNFIPSRDQIFVKLASELSAGVQEECIPHAIKGHSCPQKIFSCCKYFVLSL